MYTQIREWWTLFLIIEKCHWAFTNEFFFKFYNLCFFANVSSLVHSFLGFQERVSCWAWCERMMIKIDAKACMKIYLPRTTFRMFIYKHTRTMMFGVLFFLYDLSRCVLIFTIIYENFNHDISFFLFLCFLWKYCDVE